MRQLKEDGFNRTQLFFTESNYDSNDVKVLEKKFDELVELDAKIKKRINEVSEKIEALEKKDKVVSDNVTITSGTKKNTKKKFRQRPHKRKGHYKTLKNGKRVWIDEYTVKYPPEMIKVTKRLGAVQWLKSLFKKSA